MTEMKRLRPLRLGIIRGGSKEFKPMATVGMQRDGSIFVSPTPVRDYSWKYGTLAGIEAMQLPPVAETQHTPKVNYHRSGQVHVSLSGEDLEHRAAQFPSLPSLTRAQIFSIVSTRTWELKSAAFQSRKGDIGTLQDTWPQSVGWSISLLSFPEGTPSGVRIMGELAPTGLIPGDPTRFAVDISGHGITGVLVGHVQIDGDVPGPDLEPATSVVALPWTTGGFQKKQESFGLWSSSARNPTIFLEPDIDIPTHDFLKRSPLGVTTTQTIEGRMAQRKQLSGAKQWVHDSGLV